MVLPLHCKPNERQALLYLCIIKCFSGRWDTMSEGQQVGVHDHAHGHLSVGRTQLQSWWHLGCIAGKVVRLYQHQKILAL